jgi:hypothetical protein
MKRVSERRLTENEVAIREANERVLRDIADLDVLVHEDGQPEHSVGSRLAGQLLYFYCECSDIGCKARVRLTLQEYEEIHKLRDHFVVAPEHEQLEIERVVMRNDPEYNVVEKLSTKPLRNPT